MDWFHELSEREQKLVMWVSALLPIVLIAWGALWFIDRYNENSIQLTSLQSLITAQEEKTHQGILADRRQNYYRSASLPPRESTAKNVYREWLTEVVQEKAGMELPGVSLLKSDKISFEGNLVGLSIPFTIRPTGTLPQLATFLNEFYAADHLHRIVDLTIKPIKKKAAGGKQVLTGELKLTITIQALALLDGPESIDEFPVYTNPARSQEEFKSILSRNIFGPANNAPAFSKPSKTEFLVGEDGTITLSAKDADKDDLLSFELIESSVQSAHLTEQPKSASVRRISLKIPSQQPGTFKFKVAVGDDGLPAKRDEMEIVVKFDMPPVDTPKGPPEPATKLATATRVHGLMQGTDGHWKALIVVHPENNRSIQVKAGDEFELDDEKFLVKSVDASTLTIEVGGKTLVFEHGSRLSEPVNTL